MTWVKICGITNLEDAQVAVEAGADAIGFVFYEKSPRNISSETARGIAVKLPSNIEKVGVFVRPSRSAVAVVEEVGLTAVQAHYGLNGDRTITNQDNLQAITCFAKMYVALPMERLLEAQDLMAATLSSFFTSNQLMANHTDTIFLDSGTQQLPGGTGKPFDWERAAPVVEQLSKQAKVVIAGGLTPTNVASAIGILKPWGVDVSSGVEETPGKKDPEKVRAFVRAVRETDAKVS